ncbi:MAG: branched-chain amino acid ABC transporter substrate-binding protein [Alphaproteobacteria bacterium]
MTLRRMRHSTAAWALLGAAAFGVAAMAAETKGPVTDDIGVIKLSKGEPIQIGVYTVLSGPDTALGLDELRAIQILVDDVGGNVAGHPIKLVTEDGQCSAEGGQIAATKLAANQKIPVALGEACSSATVPGAPILWKAGIPSIGISPSAPKLTDPARSKDFDGFVRVVANDLEAGQKGAEWAYNVEKAKKMAAIHDGSPYAQGLAQAFADNFKKLGGTVTSIEAISPTDTDMKPMLTKIATDKPDIVFMPIFVAAMAHITRQAPGIPGLEKTTLVGADGGIVPDFKQLAGDAVLKVKLAVTDTDPARLGPKYPELVKRYKAKFGEPPIGNFHMNAYDSALLAVDAIKRVAKQDKDGNTYIGRKALRDAIFATKNLPGMYGTITCTPNGDCAKYKFGVYQYVSVADQFDMGKNPKKIYAGN